jgi:hypothetical protein
VISSSGCGGFSGAISGDVVELERDYTKPQQFSMTRLPREQDDLVVAEKSVDEFRTDWFVLHSNELAELKYGDKTTSCIVESQQPASS